MEKLKYSPEEYAALDMDEYRRKYPEETKALTDQQLFEVVANTDDDLSDDAWKQLFSENATA